MKRRRQSTRGFTLVEMLLVVGIIAVIAALTTPAVMSSLRGSQLTQGAQAMIAEMEFARQTALTRNRLVEVRFYRTSSPDRAEGAPEDRKFRAFQSFALDEQGNAVPLEKIHWLPNAIIADSSATLSSLLGAGQAKSWTALDPQVSLPVVKRAYDAFAFQFKPDGSTTLSPVSQTWFLTLHGVTDGDGLSTLPQNFFTLQIDPQNGRIRNYRP